MNEASRPSSLTDSKEPFLRQVKIRNFKSIEACRVRFGRLTVLVGRNGSGKSNFLEALRFVAESLQTSLDHAIRDRGGIEAVRRRSTGHPRNFAIELEIRLPSRDIATYGFEVAARKEGGFVVKREQLRVEYRRGQVIAGYRRENAEVVSSSIENGPPVQPDRLYLVNVSGFPRFLDVFSALTSMGFYNLNPDRMKKLQSPDAGDLLQRDGSNIASVIGRLRHDRPDIMRRITSYLQTIVPDLSDVERVALGPQETLQFRQRVEGSKHPWKFYAASMSDGTLRALGELVAVTQLVERKTPVHLVGIEEPETALHPAAAGALMEALREAAVNTQILVTTHSPDLCDQIETDRDRLLVVRARDGISRIAGVDKASLEAIQRHLYLPGELLRMDQLEPDPADLAEQEQLVLFEPVAAA
ncbi:MAG: AAA family ATPase [bacterium]|nr:AAA family ATPase [bacterium]